MTRILCVEDNDDSQFMLHRRLSRAGFDVKLAREDLDSKVSYGEMLKFNLVRSRSN